MCIVYIYVDGGYIRKFRDERIWLAFPIFLSSIQFTHFNIWFTLFIDIFISKLYRNLSASCIAVCKCIFVLVVVEEIYENAFRKDNFTCVYLMSVVKSRKILLNKLENKQKIWIDITSKNLNLIWFVGDDKKIGFLKDNPT